MLALYTKTVRLAAAAVLLLGAAALLFFLTHPLKPVGNVSPDVLKAVLAAQLLAFAVLLPASAVLVRKARETTWWIAAVSILAMASNSIMLGDSVASAPQSLFSLLAVVISLAMAVVSLFAAGEGRSGKPSQSRF
ncbi:hypothetical protein [Streptomyces sp. NBC_01481]|uniref:hypothetical protein n=1 Tax=Streptomyces sp. NBC_01481 TaxID=2975869 RepID=UPI00225AA8EA|nr:hypothetical protein [Streptomyces sp. NBC_01481]MCX4584518.1 hypothetical protein [Streptomyces sp. NBC_01481]